MKKILIFAFVIAICSALCLTAFAEGASEGGEYKSIFDIAGEFVMENSAEILSLLTFIGSLVLAFTYKKGLLPKLSGALKGIGGSVGTLRENTEKAIVTISEKIDEVNTESKNTERLCEALGERVAQLASTLEEVKGEKEERDAMRAILTAQVDMLYDVFMTSALPKYSKDAVAERITAMRSAITGAEEKDA